MAFSFNRYVFSCKHSSEWVRKKTNENKGKREMEIVSFVRFLWTNDTNVGFAAAAAHVVVVC